MILLDEIFNVAPEFFYEYLERIIEKIRAALFLLLPGEFCLVPVPFSKPISYQDRENGRVYERYQDVIRERIKQFDIVLENSGIGYILVEHLKTDTIRVRIFPYARIKEIKPSGKLYPNEGPNVLKQLANELFRIEPGHPKKSRRSPGEAEGKSEINDPYKKKVLERAKQLKADGLTWTQVARELEISERTLRDWRNNSK